MSITTKLKEIEAEAKQLLGLKKEELEHKNKELVERCTRLESDSEKLALREKQFKDRWRELEMHVLEIEEDRHRATEQLRELEGQRKELDRIREQFDADKKKLEERIHETDRKEKQMEGRITGLIQDLIERKQHLEAIRYVYDYNLIEKFPLGSLLKDHIETSKIESAAIIKSGNNSLVAQSQGRTKMMNDVEAAITCIKKYNISSEYSPDNLTEMISSLDKPDKEQKEADFSVPVSSIEPKAVVSTEGNISGHDDPLPKRRMLLDGKSISTDNPEPEKQVCGSEKDIGVLLCRNLHLCSMRVKVVEILQSSSNPAGLVLDAMRLCFLPKSRCASEEIPMKWCISLLKELRGYTIEQCNCQEASNLVIKWMEILKGEKSWDPMEIACFLLFHEVYQLGFTDKALVVPPITLAYREQLLDVFQQIGLPEFLPDMINRWIGMNHRLEAMRYIHSLQLWDRFSAKRLSAKLWDRFTQVNIGYASR